MPPKDDIETLVFARVTSDGRLLTTVKRRYVGVWSQRLGVARMQRLSHRPLAVCPVGSCTCGLMSNGNDVVTDYQKSRASKTRKKSDLTLPQERTATSSLLSLFFLEF